MLTQVYLIEDYMALPCGEIMACISNHNHAILWYTIIHQYLFIYPLIHVPI